MPRAWTSLAVGLARLGTLYDDDVEGRHDASLIEFTVYGSIVNEGMEILLSSFQRGNTVRSDGRTCRSVESRLYSGMCNRDKHEEGRRPPPTGQR